MSEYSYTRDVKIVVKLPKAASAQVAEHRAIVKAMHKVLIFLNDNPQLRATSESNWILRRDTDRIVITFTVYAP